MSFSNYSDHSYGAKNDRTHKCGYIFDVGRGNIGHYKWLVDINVIADFVYDL